MNTFFKKLRKVKQEAVVVFGRNKEFIQVGKNVYLRVNLEISLMLLGAFYLPVMRQLFSGNNNKGGFTFYES